MAANSLSKLHFSLVVDALNCRGPYEAAAGRDLAVLLDESAVQYPHHAEVKREDNEKHGKP